MLRPLSSFDRRFQSLMALPPPDEDLALITQRKLFEVEIRLPGVFCNILSTSGAGPVTMPVLKCSDLPRHGISLVCFGMRMYILLTACGSDGRQTNRRSSAMVFLSSSNAVWIF